MYSGSSGLLAYAAPGGSILMKENKLHTPNGVKDILPDEYSVKRGVENRIESVFHRYGYRSVMPPTFEYIDVFTGIGSVDQSKIYKFIDRDGSVLALRSDLTPQISRIVATNDWDGMIPLRFCYVANTYRYNQNFQGKLNEFTQAGVELYGASSDDANAEVIAVAINALLAAGLEDFRIDIGNVEFLHGILEETGLPEEELREIRKYILKREYVAVEAAVKKRKMPKGVKEILSNLASFIGDTQMLDKCGAAVTSDAAKAALNKLKNIYETLKLYNLDKYVLFDLSLMGHLDYYTGVIFRGYTYGTGFSIVEGGRCDKVTASFGKKISSIGFAIGINDLLDAVSNQNVSYEIMYADTLVAYSAVGKEAALRCADSLRDDGLYVENSLLGGDIEVNLDYAKKRGLNGMLYFDEGGSISLFNLKTGERSEVSIDELLNRDGGCQQ